VAEDFLSPQELADYLNVPLATVYRWRHLQEGPRGHRVGRHVRFRRSEVEAWLEERADPDPAPAA
jgi:excisionase family DNA binding protein